MHDQAAPALKIHQLAQAAGVSVQAVRDYETWGVLPPVLRRANGYRAYTPRHLAALHTARALIAAGYTRRDLVTVMTALHTGALVDILAIVDRYHAALADRRRLLAVDADLLPAVTDLALPVTIGQAATLLGVRPSTIRFWESLGLLTVERNPASGFREFSTASLSRLATIQHLRRLDCSWATIREVLAERDDTEPGSVEDRPLADLDHASALTTRATALLWSYSRLTDTSPLAMIEAIFAP